ncbi:MAG: hypothetical protein ACC656_07085 [Candidatus Heimdallarchaeota archaeon]
MGDIKVGEQAAIIIINKVINNPAELSQIKDSLQAIRAELAKIEMPEGVNREQITKPVDELLTLGIEAQKDGNMVKDKLEKVNEYLGLFGKTLNGIKTIAPYIKTIVKIFGISS